MPPRPASPNVGRMPAMPLTAADREWNRRCRCRAQLVVRIDARQIKLREPLRGECASLECRVDVCERRSRQVEGPRPLSLRGGRRGDQRRRENERTGNMVVVHVSVVAFRIFVPGAAGSDAWRTTRRPYPTAPGTPAEVTRTDRTRLLGKSCTPPATDCLKSVQPCDDLVPTGAGLVHQLEPSARRARVHPPQRFALLKEELLRTHTGHLNSLGRNEDKRYRSELQAPSLPVTGAPASLQVN